MDVEKSKVLKPKGKKKERKKEATLEASQKSPKGQRQIKMI